MDAREIQALRAMLAEQAAQTAVDKPKLGLLSRLLGRPAAEPVAFGLQDAAQAGDREDAEDLLLSQSMEEPLPPELFHGDLAPRRPAFGQRREPALELIEPAPRTPARLTLTAPNGLTVGEIILHEAAAAPRRRPFEAVQPETPFFPEDLEDAPARRPLVRLASPAAEPSAAPAAKPSREVAATMLLAGLAARLAHEEAALSARLTAARPSRLAA